RPGPRGDGGPLSGAALRGAAPAGRGRAGARGRPAADADGRAVRGDRPDQPGEAAGRVPRAAGESPQDGRVRDPRHRRGDQDGRQDRDPPRRRRAGPVRHAEGDPRASRRRVRGPVRRRRPRHQAALVDASDGRRAARSQRRRAGRRAGGRERVGQGRPLDPADRPRPPPGGRGRRGPRDGPAHARAPRAADRGGRRARGRGRGGPAGPRGRPCRRGGGRGGGPGASRPVNVTTHLAASGPVIPNFSTHSSSCAVHNRVFCWDWLKANWGTVLWPALRQHVILTLIAVSIGFAIAMALALYAHRHRWAERPVLLFTTFLYTIPSLALFELLVAPVGPNVFAAEIALVSYTLLILFRNIVTGLRSVPAEVLEAAEGMGMTSRQALLRVELPLALPAIVAGLRIAVVTIIALATIVYTIYDRGLG